MPVNAASLQFFGNGDEDVDRVKIAIDDPNNGLPGPPADIGGEDFTIEFWIKAGPENQAGDGADCGAGYNWIWGNIIIDRDRYNLGRTYGISIMGGVIHFGVMNVNYDSYTLCSTTSVVDNEWHYIAVQRRRSDGWMWVYVDGVLEAQFDGPDGDISYPDDAQLDPTACGGSPCLHSDPYLVFGGEKHVLGLTGYIGLLTQVRLSNILRVISLPGQALVSDSNTIALYHFNEAEGITLSDTSGAAGGPSNGVIMVGGTPTGPLWSTDSPFNVVPNPGDPGVIQFSESDGRIVESDASVDFIINRSGGFGSVSVDYLIGASGSTASQGDDYALTQQAANGTLYWADDNTSAQTVRIDVLNDSMPEDVETVVLQLSNPANGARLGNATASLTIVDDDSPTNPSTPNTASGGGSAFSLILFALILLVVTQRGKYPLYN